jgi:hypothetical protein
MFCCCRCFGLTNSHIVVVVKHDSDHWWIGVARSHVSVSTFVLDIEDSEAPLGYPQLLSQDRFLTVVLGVSQDSTSHGVVAISG